MKYAFRIAFVVLMLVISVAHFRSTRVLAFDAWKSPPISVHQAHCHPGCAGNYNGDPVHINVIAPDGLDPRTARLECSGNGCQFDHGDVVIHDSTFIGTWYSRSEAVTVYAVADWKK